MILKGNIVHAPACGTVEVHAGSWLVTQGECVVGIYDTLPQTYEDQPVIDWGDSLIIPAFHDLHIHAPQIVNRGIGYDEQLLPWMKPAGDAFRVILGDYVSTEDGTGIVHIAPTFGADDDRVAKMAGIAPMLLVDKDGTYARRDDLMDTRLLIKTLKDKLNNP